MASALRFTLLSLALLCGVAQAQLAYTAKPVNMRAGPARDFPIVAVLPAGYQVSVQGCLGDYTWCDVVAANSRGWVYAGNINSAYQNSYAPVITWGPVIGFAIVGFALDDYWGRHYWRSPWYAERHRWAGRQWPAPRPTVRPHQPPAPRPPNVRPPRPPAVRPQPPGPPNRPDGRPPRAPQPPGAASPMPAPPAQRPRGAGPHERPAGPGGAARPYVAPGGRPPGVSLPQPSPPSGGERPRRAQDNSARGQRQYP